MTVRTFLPFCGASCVAIVLAGCGGGGAKLFPATGTVIYKNQPVEGAVVSFRCEAANKTATGTTDAQGRFDLTTYQGGKGAVAGKHKVIVTKMSAPSGGAAGATSMEDAFKKPSAAAQAKSLLPPKYGDAARPLLEYTVSPDAANDFKIELTD